MQNKRVLLLSLVGLALLMLTSVALAGTDRRPRNLVETVRQATSQFKDVRKAEAAGYAFLHGCVSGPQEGAMGVHYVNGNLVGDGVLDAQQPEALLYEPKDGKLQLVAVEYIVIAEGWDASNEGPPVLMGQFFNYVGAPNRYRLPGFYELHVWMGKSNPEGTFADWNPRVSCEDFVGPESHH